MEKNYIILPGLAENDPATLTPLQEALKPHADTLILIWWAVWCGTFLYVFVRHLALPLIKHYVAGIQTDKQ